MLDNIKQKLKRTLDGARNALKRTNNTNAKEKRRFPPRGR